MSISGAQQSKFATNVGAVWTRISTAGPNNPFPSASERNLTWCISDMETKWHVGVLQPSIRANPERNEVRITPMQLGVGCPSNSKALMVQSTKLPPIQ